MRLVDVEDVVDALGNMGESIDLKEAEEWIDTVPTAMQLWTSVKNKQPDEDGIYLTVYDFWCFENCVSAREFRNGRWGEEERRGAVKFWMPIPEIPKDNKNEQEKV